MRTGLLLIALACLTVLGASALHFDVLFADPDVIFWRFLAPSLGAAICLAFVVLPARGRLALGSLILTVALIEGSFGLVNTLAKDDVETHVAPDYYQEDPVLGWVPAPEITTPATKSVNGSPI